MSCTDPVTSSNPVSIRAALADAVTTAMKQRDRSALTVYRTALAAIDNAAAVPLRDEHRAGAVELSPAGVGRTEAERRTLTEAELADIVRLEAQERLVAADSLEGADPDAARRLRAEAGLLLAILNEPDD